MDAKLRTIGERLLPWLTPAVVVGDVALVLTGRLELGHAVLLFLAIELVIGLMLAVNVYRGFLQFRRDRANGERLWVAAENGLSRVMPRRLARFVLFEPHSWALLARTAYERCFSPDRRAAQLRNSFDYTRQLRVMFVSVIVLLLVEGLVVSGIIVVVVSDPVWHWLTLGIHIYTLVWFACFAGSFVCSPHEVDAARSLVILRDGLMVDIAVHLDDIVVVRSIRASSGTPGRSGLVISDGNAVLACGPQLNVELRLRDGSQVQTNGEIRTDISTMRLTCDDPARFVRRLVELQSV